MPSPHEKTARNAKMAWYYTRLHASASELGRFYGVRRSTVLKILRRLGVEIRPRGNRYGHPGMRGEP